MDPIKTLHQRKELRQEYLQRLKNSKYECESYRPFLRTTRQQRAKMFCRWLVEAFGVEVLSRGSGVLDIAGGQGDVCFELSIHYDIPSILIDPKKRLKNEEQEKQLSPQHPELPLQIVQSFDANLFSMEEVQQCSAIIGMHPDEATETIVDFALQFHKPFAILPCCVLSHKFPTRRDPNGKLVQSYDEFIEYLSNKVPNCERVQLDFPGRNLVLYRCAP